MEKRKLSENQESGKSRSSSAGGFFLRWIFSSLVGLLVLEGFCSLYWLKRDYVDYVKALPRAEKFTEERHAQYDPELGWVHVPNATLVDFYGPGRTLTVNAQGFRGLEAYDVKPDDRFRVVCLGDSFTLGYGVGDRETWPARLEAARPGLQTVNMGQGGYSIGQCWLWFQRDALALKPDAVALAVVPDDLWRLPGERMLNGYGKPTFHLEDDAVRVRNQPVPPKVESGRVIREWWKTRDFLFEHGGLLRTLLRLTGKPSLFAQDRWMPEQAKLAFRMIEEMQTVLVTENIPFVLVLLPELVDLTDLEAQKSFQNLSKDFQILSDRLGFAYLDLLPAFSDAFAGDAQRGFDMAAVGSWPHYNAEGYQFVAEQVDAFLADRVKGYPAGSTNRNRNHNPDPNRNLLPKK